MARVVLRTTSGLWPLGSDAHQRQWQCPFAQKPVAKGWSSKTEKPTRRQRQHGWELLWPSWSPDNSLTVPAGSKESVPMYRERLSAFGRNLAILHICRGRFVLLVFA